MICVVVVAFAILAVMFIASVVIPWAGNHDGEGFIEALKKTIKHN